jgi:hypothetical protein
VFIKTLNHGHPLSVCYGWGSVSLAFHPRGLGSIPGQSVSYLFWTRWCWSRFIPEHFTFPCQGHSTIALYLPLSECYSDQKGKEMMAGNVQKAALLQKSGSLWYRRIFTSFLGLMKCGTATGFSLRTSVFPHHYHSTNASYSSSYSSFTRKVNCWSLENFKKECFSRKSQSIG